MHRFCITYFRDMKLISFEMKNNPKESNSMFKTAGILSLLTVFTSVAHAQEIKPYSPAVGREYPTNVNAT
jgi:hypothetical protein